MDKQKELQKLLVVAQNALEVAKDFAVENDLQFEFAGLRRGVIEYPWDEQAYNRTATEVGLDILNISEEWLGSWSPGCG